VPSLLLTLFSTLFVLSGLTSGPKLQPILPYYKKPASKEGQIQGHATAADTFRPAAWVAVVMRDKKGHKAYLRVLTAGISYYITTVDNIISAATIGTAPVAWW